MPEPTKTMLFQTRTKVLKGCITRTYIDMYKIQKYSDKYLSKQYIGHESVFFQIYDIGQKSVIYDSLRVL